MCPRRTGAGVTHRPPWILPVIVVSQFAGTSIWFSGNAVLGELMKSLPSAPPLSGWITGAVQLGFIAGTLVFAIFSVADRHSPRWVFLLCAAAGALSNLLIAAAAATLPGLLILRFATGFFLAGIYPVGMKIAAGWYARGLGNALGFLVGALVLGTAFPHLLRSTLESLPWQAVMFVSSGVCLSGGLLMALLVPDGPYLTAAAPFNPRAVATLLIRHRQLRDAATGYFGHMWELYTLWAFIPMFLGVYASTRPGAALNLPAWSFAIIAMGTLGCIVGGLVSVRYGSRRVAQLQLAISGLCCLVSPMVFAASPKLFTAFMLLWGVTVVGDSPQFSTIVARSAPQELVGSALTLVNCIGFSITVVSLALVQWLASVLPLQYVLVVLTPGPAVGLIAMGSWTASKPPAEATER